MMLHLVSTAVNPALRLVECLNKWDYISWRLREPPRKRLSQVESLRQKLPCILS